MTASSVAVCSGIGSTCSASGLGDALTLFQMLAMSKLERWRCLAARATGKGELSTTGESDGGRSKGAPLTPSSVLADMDSGRGGAVKSFPEREGDPRLMIGEVSRTMGDRVCGGGDSLPDLRGDMARAGGDMRPSMGEMALGLIRAVRLETFSDIDVD
ncbi:BZ3500_MvSof-1268-A1-R1_Chr2-1g04252 [Microbotryum saponariae]|uniref:BZ3500_MvSof-1268-A1-R1_Chr2-1g04252 protein n=1 Tax=Microbotryum saponariae TaxID=289078 RepID=A0A2X0KE41_9BASI|nr:BZ3500_MvSof-1268-A1-R1_Chr2-1g04252 [Microbotryum saponariae]SCZ91239.1 BZ3501_MvSof-1269-A2-R1_Chr2-1g03908 [Microbotryum saponariae]